MPWVGEDREVVVEANAGEGGVLVEGGGEFQRDGPLACPAVDKNHTSRVVVDSEVVQRGGVDAAAPHDGHRVVREVQTVMHGRPPAHKDSDGGAGAGKRGQCDIRTALGENEFGDDADRGRQPVRTGCEHLCEQLAVRGVGLVLDRQ